MAIETTWAEQCSIKNVWAVCCSHDDDAFCCFEAVHFGKQLIKRLLTLIVPAAKSCSTLSSNGVNFVDENNGASHFCRLLKQVTHATCTNAHEHLHEVRTSYRKKANSCFAGNCSGEQCFSCSRRANEQNTLWYARTNFFKSLWHAKEINYFFDLLLYAFISSHISKRCAWFVGVVILCATATN